MAGLEQAELVHLLLFSSYINTKKKLQKDKTAKMLEAKLHFDHYIFLLN